MSEPPECLDLNPDDFAANFEGFERARASALA